MRILTPRPKAYKGEQGITPIFWGSMDTYLSKHKGSPPKHLKPKEASEKEAQHSHSFMDP